RRLDLGLGLERRTRRTECIVLVCSRDAEDGHHFVAGSLFDRPFVRLEDTADRCEGAGAGLADELGVRRLCEPDVGKEDRDGLASRLRCRRVFAYRLSRGSDGLCLAQNRLLELSKRPAWFDSKLVEQELPRLSVDGERICLAAGTVKGEHQLGPKALTEWM